MLDAPQRILKDAGALRGVAKRAVRRVRAWRAGPFPFVDSPEEAMARPAGAADFPCPIDQCVMENARGFGPTRWHPSAAAAAVIGLTCSARALESVPPHGHYALPWLHYAPDVALELTEKWHARDLSQHGLAASEIASHGFNAHGPVSDALGQLEFRRLDALVAVIRRNGFDRTAGSGDRRDCVQVDVLRRGSERRFIFCGGQHRTAVMDAMGAAQIPARRRNIIDRDDAPDWPNVRSGLWSLTEALRYFDHLFDFDSRQWAAARGLCETVNAPAIARH